jgi:hypothetical protein
LKDSNKKVVGVAGVCRAAVDSRLLVLQRIGTNVFSFGSMRRHENTRLLAGFLFVMIVTALATGCTSGKPGALRQAEQLAKRVRDEEGSVVKLRQWFTEVQSSPHSKDENLKPLSIPNTLDGDWWRRARASASWSDEGNLQSISVTQDMFEFITIGPPTATSEDLHLTGQPPTFHAKIADGIYAWVRYK